MSLRRAHPPLLTTLLALAFLVVTAPACSQTADLDQTSAVVSDEVEAMRDRLAASGLETGPVTTHEFVCDSALGRNIEGATNRHFSFLVTTDSAAESELARALLTGTGRISMSEDRDDPMFLTAAGDGISSYHAEFRTAGDSVAVVGETGCRRPG